MRSENCIRPIRWNLKGAGESMPTAYKLNDVDSKGSWQSTRSPAVGQAFQADRRC
jgi:hypothetical protein